MLTQNDGFPSTASLLYHFPPFLRPLPDDISANCYVTGAIVKGFGRSGTLYQRELLRP